MTVVAHGTARIDFSYQGVTSRVHTIVAAPTGPSAVSGRIWEPADNGNNLAGVRVSNPSTGQATETRVDGTFSLAGVSGQLVAEKEGYERLEFDPFSGEDLPMQRTVRVTAGEWVTPLRLAPDDVHYFVGADVCFPCRLVRVVAPRGGTLQLTLTWTSPGGPLMMWSGGQRLRGTSAEIPVGAGELVIHVGYWTALTRPAGISTGFTLSTSLR